MALNSRRAHRNVSLYPWNGLNLLGPLKQGSMDSRVNAWFVFFSKFNEFSVYFGQLWMKVRISSCFIECKYFGQKIGLVYVWTLAAAFNCTHFWSQKPTPPKLWSYQPQVLAQGGTPAVLHQYDRHRSLARYPVPLAKSNFLQHWTSVECCLSRRLDNNVAVLAAD